MRSPNRRSLHTIRHAYVHPISECICQYESIWLTVHVTQFQGAGLCKAAFTRVAAARNESHCQHQSRCGSCVHMRMRLPA